MEKKRLNPDEIIKKYQLTPHTEGGYFKETYRSDGIIPHKALPLQYNGNRNYYTSILFFLRQGDKSHFHQLGSDEIWHFYLGGPMILILIFPNSNVKEIILGQDIRNNQQLQYLVPAGTWLGGFPLPDSEYSLVGCTTSPGFDYSDFELAKKEELLKQFPDAKNWIDLLCKY